MGYTPPPDDGQCRGWSADVLDDPVVAKSVAVWLFVALLLSLGGMRCSVSVVSHPSDAATVEPVEGPR
jgi:hypothetical protein